MTLISFIAEQNLQNIATLAIVGFALACLARRAYGLFASEQVKGCATGCSGCPAARVATAPVLVNLEIHRNGAAGGMANRK